MTSLNEKQTRFVAEYLIDRNATQAAVRAGYSRKSAGQQGFDLLKNPYIAEAIQAKTTKALETAGLTADRVMQELGRVVLFDPRKLFNADGTLKKITELDDDTAACLTGFDVTEVSGAVGTQSSLTKKIKWLDKNQAIVTAMRRFGMLCDRYEHTGAGGRPLVTPTDPVDIARRVAFLLAQAINTSAE